MQTGKVIQHIVRWLDDYAAHAGTGGKPVAPASAGKPPAPAASWSGSPAASTRL